MEYNNLGTLKKWNTNSTLVEMQIGGHIAQDQITVENELNRHFSSVALVNPTVHFNNI